MDSEQLSITWEKSRHIPPYKPDKVQQGLAGAFIGIHDNKLIIAGGSNFENGLPWKGASKLYHKAIYVLQKEDYNNFKWIDQQLIGELMFPVAYGASISLHDGIICIGGENEEVSVKNVFRIVWSADMMHFDTLPDLPLPLANEGAVNIGSIIYVAGGSSKNIQTNVFLFLELNNLEKGWKTLPSLPQPLSHPVMVCQSDGTETCIYVIGGRNKNGITSYFLSSVWKYSPSRNKWEIDNQIHINKDVPFGLAAGTGIAYGLDKIILFGGDKGIIFNKIESLLYSIANTNDTVEKKLIYSKRDSIQENHTGFYRDILLYNTVNHSWIKIGEIPGKSQVTTTAVRWGDEIIIPAGEIRPGIRTSEIKMLIIENGK